MDMLSSVLRYHKPEQWVEADYKNRRYHLVDLSEDDEDYIKILTEFKQFSLNVKSVQRVQNPYTLGAYILRKEQLEKRGTSFQEKRMYHSVSSCDKDKALDFNLDVRRYFNSSSVFSKQPFLSTNPNEYCSVIRNVIIVCKVIIPYTTISSITITSDCDTERVPEFVVTL